MILDRALFLADIRASRAHVRGLAGVGVLPVAEAQAIDVELDALAADFEAGRFVLDDRHEDGHSAIEAFLVERLGDVGKKVHTGRSRNDQVLVAVRLHVRDALASLARGAALAAEAFLDRAGEEAKTPMPGYTHLQRAVPSSVGLWLAGFAEAFIDDAALARATAAWMDACPLGTAAGYGVNLPLDRQGVSDELGFARLLVNPVYAQNSRGKLDLQALMALLQALLDVRRFAWDLSLYTTAEFGFVKLPAEYTTGSSIMPNKRNPDVVELLRASPAPVIGALAEVESLLSLPSGYQRDLQATGRGGRGRSPTASRRSRSCRISCAGWISIERGWRPRSRPTCTRPTWRWISPGRACPSGTPTGRWPTAWERSGSGARERASRRG